MAANVEEMFYVGRETPWHGLGRQLDNPPTSADAIVAAGLDWEVEQKAISIMGTDIEIPDTYANVRSSDNTVLGVVGNRYQIVQNKEAFEFTDSLIGEGCVYETAGSLRNGKQIWLLARLPESIQIAGDEVLPYLVFTNTHDGSGAIKVCASPIRVVCNNTLNLALKNAKRTWSARHTGSIEYKLQEASETLNLANKYMKNLKEESEKLAVQKVNEQTLAKLCGSLVPINEDMSDRQKANAKDIVEDIVKRYYEAPDLKVMDHSKLRFIHAVADSVTHRTPARRTQNYKENLFQKGLDGYSLLDKAYDIVLAA